MAAMTADEIEYVRAMSGDDCLPYDVGATLLQKLWDRNSSDECATIVFVLRIREAKAAVLTNESSEGQSKNLSDKHAHIKAMRVDWEARCGMSGGTLSMGTFDLNLDADCDGEYLSRIEQWLS
jgi:hypothetical protein